MALIIDTNVFAIAEGMHGDATDGCKAACTSILLRIDGGYPILVDDSDEILSEYVAALRAAPTSGLAVKLASRLYRTRHGEPACRKVEITRSNGSYEEVPAGLRDFDPDDQKFIAVAASAGGGFPLVAGLDGEWWDRQADFPANGLSVQFPCLADLI